MSGADVSGSVLSIIAAFTSGLDIFKNLAERRRARRSKHVHSRPVQHSDDELRLSNSLRRGPVDIQREYERNFAIAGWRYAKGDSIAQASLAETLLKLNTGLVGIISSFLSGDRNDVRLDYKSLTRLSDDSRVEAINTLSHLYHRLSQSDLIPYQPQPACARCGSQKHNDCAPRSTGLSKPSTGPRTRKQGPFKPSQARTSPKGMVKTELVIIRRPRNKRTTSSSTASSNTSAGSAQSSKSAPSTAATTPCTSPLPSPELTTSYPFGPQPQPLSSKLDVRPPNPPPAYSRNPTSQQRTETWAAAHAISELPAHPLTPSPPPLPQKPPATAAHPPFHPIVPPKPPELRSAPAQPPLAPLAPLAARRLNKQTLSTYTFASDSTKLGEIPMRKWIEPYDFTAMEKLNEEARETGWVPQHALPAPRPRRGFFKFFRWANGGKAVSVVK